NIHSSHRLPPGVLYVGESIPDHIFQEYFQNFTSFLVDQTTDTLDASSASKTRDGGLGDALNIVPEDLHVPLGSSLSILLE
ncbi:hypothetical protein LINGRAHAP2_LOCUS13544, partial [Linum grandiflorum]